MQRVDEPQLASFLDKREEKDSRVLNPVFRGKVVEVRGVSPNLEVQVVKPGEAASDGHTYPVLNSWEPAIGDDVDIMWRDDQVGLAVFPVSTAALNRLPARHPYSARVYWTGSFTTGIGFNQIGYNNTDFDQNGMLLSSALVAPVSGTYLIIVRTGTSTANVDVAAAIYYNGAIISQGSRAVAPATPDSSLVVDERQLSAGDSITGYIYTGAAVALESGSAYNYLVVSLISRYHT